jgi:hypothetical protein
VEAEDSKSKSDIATAADMNSKLVELFEPVLRSHCSPEINADYSCLSKESQMRVLSSLQDLCRRMYCQAASQLVWTLL